MKLTALDPTDPRLRQDCSQVSKRELRTKPLQAEIDTMLDFVYGQNNRGPKRAKHRPSTVGLSANQVGLMKQISVVDMAIGQKGFHDVHTLINPQLIWHSKTTTTSTEGCVNLPQIWGEIQRFKRVKVTAWDRSGNQLIIDCTGLPAVLLQHEIDHLQGRLFIDYLPDPTKALLVTSNTMKDFTRKNRAKWPDHTDVSKLVRPFGGLEGPN